MGMHLNCFQRCLDQTMQGILVHSTVTSAYPQHKKYQVKNEIGKKGQQREITNLGPTETIIDIR